MSKIERPVLTLANATAWSQWLSREAETSNGVWLILAKKGVTEPTSLSYEQALDEALCHGWIDGQGCNRDETTMLRGFTPRRTHSLWSKRNVGYIERLEGEGRMQPRGRREVERAKADGRWENAYSQANNKPPADLLAAIAAVPDAQATWDILTKTNQFTICFRLAALRTQAGREKRLQAFVDMLARGETPHPQKRSRESASAPKRTIKPKPVVTNSSANEPPRRRSERIQKTTRS